MNGEFQQIRKYKKELIRAKNTVTEMKNTLEVIKSKLDDTEKNGSAMWKTE